MGLLLGYLKSYPDPYRNLEYSCKWSPRKALLYFKSYFKKGFIEVWILTNVYSHVTTPPIQHITPTVPTHPFAVGPFPLSWSQATRSTFCAAISLLRIVSHHVEVGGWKNNLNKVFLPVQEKKCFCPCLRRQATIS